jgi:hypothetical protein
LAVPRLAVSPDRIVMVCLVGLLTALIVVHMLVEMIIGKQCPACSRWTLRRLARHRRFYRCTACRGRFKRGLGPWLDASGPEDDWRYRKRSEAGTWKGFAAPENVGQTTSGRLLRNKRTRAQENDVTHSSHPSARHWRLGEAQRRAREMLSHLRDWVDRPA